MRAEDLKGDRHGLLGTLNPSRTAVLAIHWQNGVITPGDPFGSSFGPVVARQGTLPRVVRVVEQSRAAGALIVYVNICNPPDIVVNNGVFLHAKETGALKCGSEAVQVVDALRPHAQDVALDHHRVSAFAGTPLAEVLAARQIDTLVLTGVATNVAVESTAREAIDRGFKTVVLSDCCAAATDAKHAASIENLDVLATGVMTAEEYLERLSQATSSVSA